MHIILIALFIIALLYGPNVWVNYTMRRYAKVRIDIPGNGAELARHLLEKFDMQHVKVEQTDENNDHYDPDTKTVRLGPKNYQDNSLTAITIAAHEVGHAIQDHRNEPLMRSRNHLVRYTGYIEKFGGALLYILPILALVLRNPFLGVLTIFTGVVIMGVSVFMHLLTLPVEYDASFNKALPILFDGDYIQKKDRAAARRILKAAAFTYVAASLFNLLNFWRWFTLLRR